MNPTGTVGTTNCDQDANYGSGCTVIGGDAGTVFNQNGGGVYIMAFEVSRLHDIYRTPSKTLKLKIMDARPRLLVDDGNHDLVPPSIRYPHLPQLYRIQYRYLRLGNPRRFLLFQLV